MGGSYKYIRYQGGRLDPDERASVYGASQLFLAGPDGLEARRYLAERGLDPPTIGAFRLGYMPFHTEHYFSGRIVMPIFDAYDGLLALSVRPATNDKDILREYCKYWNESYEKGAHLYGLNFAKLSIIRAGFAICVEGQADVMVCHAFGLTNTVGVLGGAFTPFHAMLLRKWTNQVVFLFDGDAAGKKHADRAMEEIDIYSFGATGLYDGQRDKKPSGRALRACRVELPEKKDPADFLLRHGTGLMKKRIFEAATPAGLNMPKNWMVA